MSVFRRHTARTRLSLAAVGAALLLSSCGGTAPGVAADVEGATITDRQVDDFARVLCALDGDAAAGNPSKSARFRSLEILLNIELSRAMVDFDRADSAQVSQAVAQSRSTREMVPADVRDTFDRAVKEYAEAQLAVSELGADSLREQGQRRPDEQDAFVEGDRLRTEFAAQADVEVDPRFGQMQDGVLTQSSGSLSVPVSELATQGVSMEPSAAFLENTPAALTCGG